MSEYFVTAAAAGVLSRCKLSSRLLHHELRTKISVTAFRGSTLPFLDDVGAASIQVRSGAGRAVDSLGKVGDLVPFFQTVDKTVREKYAVNILHRDFRVHNFSAERVSL